MRYIIYTFFLIFFPVSAVNTSFLKRTVLWSADGLKYGFMGFVLVQKIFGARWQDALLLKFFYKKQSKPTWRKDNYPSVSLLDYVTDHGRANLGRLWTNVFCNPFNHIYKGIIFDKNEISLKEIFRSWYFDIKNPNHYFFIGGCLLGWSVNRSLTQYRTVSMKDKLSTEDKKNLEYFNKIEVFMKNNSLFYRQGIIIGSDQNQEIFAQNLAHEKNMEYIDATQLYNPALSVSLLSKTSGRKLIYAQIANGRAKDSLMETISASAGDLLNIENRNILFVLSIQKEDIKEFCNDPTINRRFLTISNKEEKSADILDSYSGADDFITSKKILLKLDALIDFLFL